jgi:ankyrin repeat protein
MKLMWQVFLGMLFGWGTPSAHAAIPRAEMNAMQRAIFYDDEVQVRALVQKNPEFKTLRGEDIGDSILHGAVRMQSLKAIRALVESGCAVNSYNKVGVTPLHVAAYFDAGAICQLLVSLGASLTITNSLGQTPLTLARERGARQCLDAMAN